MRSRGDAGSFRHSAGGANRGFKGGFNSGSSRGHRGSGRNRWYSADPNRRSPDRGRGGPPTMPAGRRPVLPVTVFTDYIW